MRNFSCCLFAICILISCPALAQQDWKKITFEGNVVTQTCEAKINGAEDVAVKLPDVRDSVLGGYRSFAGLTTFTIGISNCAYQIQDGVQKVKMFLRLPTGQNQVGGALVNMHAPQNEAAKKVWLQLCKDSECVAPLNISSISSGVAIDLDMQVQDGKASHILGARYVAGSAMDNGSVKPGKFSAVIEYRLEYL